MHLQVTEETTVYELKQQVERHLHIPVAHQKILFVGRTLVDEKNLAFYTPALRSGSRLTLVIKGPEPLKDVMCKVFKRYYNDDQSERLAKDFMAEHERRVQTLSLDDLERIAGFYLERDYQKTATPTVSAATVKVESN